ncbi:hypothetical protein D3C80_1307150 [compost metagenome]
MGEGVPTDVVGIADSDYLTLIRRQTHALRIVARVLEQGLDKGALGGVVDVGAGGPALVVREYGHPADVTIHCERLEHRFRVDARQDHLLGGVACRAIEG